MLRPRGPFVSATLVALGLVAAVVFVLGVRALAVRYLGAATGQPCAEASDCRGAGAWCVADEATGARYCSYACREDAACPTRWSCAASGYERHEMLLGAPVGAETDVDVCWREAPKRDRREDAPRPIAGSTP